MKKWLRTDDRGRLVHSRRETLGSKKKGSLDGTGYKREDARCGREGTRGPSKQIRRTSRFLLDLLLDLSIYLSTLRRSWRASPIGTIERGDPLPFHSPPLSLSLSSSPFFFPLGGPETRNTEMCTRGRHVNNHGRMARLNSAEPCRSLTRHRRVSGRRSRSLKRGWRRNWGSSRGTVGEEGGGWWWGEREAENETARRRGRKDRRKWCDKGKKLRGEREEDLKRRCAHKVLRSVWASGMNEMGKGGRGFVVGGGESERRGRMDEILLLDGAWRKNGKDEKW